MKNMHVECPNCHHKFDANAAELTSQVQNQSSGTTEMMGGEPVVFIAKPVWRAFIPRFVAAAIFAFLCIKFLQAFELGAVIPVQYVAPVICGLILLNIIYELFSSEYKLTTQRLFIKHGLFSVNYDELELFRVKDVKFNQTLTQRPFGVGNITIYSTDESTPELKIINVARPFELKEKIRKINRVSRKEENITTTEFIHS